MYPPQLSPLGLSVLHESRWSVEQWVLLSTDRVRQRSPGGLDPLLLSTVWRLGCGRQRHPWLQLDLASWGVRWLCGFCNGVGDDTPSLLPLTHPAGYQTPHLSLSSHLPLPGKVCVPSLNDMATHKVVVLSFVAACCYSCHDYQGSSCCIWWY